MPQSLSRCVAGVVLFAALSSACANPGVVQLSRDTYMLRKEDHAGIFGSAARLKADVISEANAFAESKDKLAVRISEREHPMGVMADWAWFEYTFKLADKDEDEKLKAEGAKVDACFDRLATDPSLSAINGKVALGSVTNQPFEMLIDTRKPNKDEKVAIGVWANMRSKCWEELEAFNAKVGLPSPMVALLGSTKTAQLHLIVLLHDGIVTYGEFARKRDDIHDAMLTGAAQIEGELAKQSAEAQARADQLALQAQQLNLQQIQTRQTQAQTLLMGIQTSNQLQQTLNQREQTLNQQRMINQMSAPRQTNCHVFGSNLNCTTW